MNISFGTCDGAFTKSSLVKCSAFVEAADDASEDRAADPNIAFNLEHKLNVSIKDYNTNWGNIPPTRALFCHVVTTHLKVSTLKTTEVTLSRLR